jgi:hypothetical protein
VDRLSDPRRSFTSMSSIGQAIAAASASLEAVLDQTPDRGLGSTVSEDLLGLDALDQACTVIRLRLLAAHDAENLGLAEGCSSTAAWWSSHTRRSEAGARADVTLARRLHGHGPDALPMTATALAAGEISPDQARAIHTSTRTLLPEDSATLEPILLEARPLAPEQLRRVGRDVAHRLADQSTEQGRWERDQASRGTELHPVGDGWHLVGHLTGQTGAGLHALLDAHSKPSPAPDGTPDPRTATQRRHDALDPSSTPPWASLPPPATAPTTAGPASSSTSSSTRPPLKGSGRVAPPGR